MTKTRVHRKMEYVFEQLKHTIGQDVRLIMKNDMKKLSIDANQVFPSPLIISIIVSLSLDVFDYRSISSNRYLLRGISSIQSQPTIKLMEIIY